MLEEVKELCLLDKELYSCISSETCTDRVVLTNKSVLHLVENLDNITIKKH